jgi:ATP-binding cassette subfamily F protein uup
VSHDRYFLDRTVDYLATFENGSFSPRYPAPYSAYQAARLKAREDRTAVAELQPPEPVGKKRPTNQETADQPQKLSWKEARELEKLETAIAELEIRKTEISQAINTAGGDYEQLQQLTDALEPVEAELDRAMSRWLALSERA